MRARSIDNREIDDDRKPGRRPKTKRIRLKSNDRKERGVDWERCCSLLTLPLLIFYHQKLDLDCLFSSLEFETFKSSHLSLNAAKQSSILIYKEVRFFVTVRKLKITSDFLFPDFEFLLLSQRRPHQVPLSSGSSTKINSIAMSTTSDNPVNLW